MKKTKQKLSATWEILSTAEYVESLDRNVNDDDLVKIYQGSFVPLFLAHRVERKQIWNVTIKTIAKADDGTLHEHEMEWAFNKPMSMDEVLNGAKHIRLEEGGIKKRWIGVTKNWLKDLDAEFDDSYKAVKAVAIARCTAVVEQRNPAAVLLGKMISWGATA